MNGDDVGAAIDSYAAGIGHVQIADAPGRGEPGTRTLDIPAYLNQLARHGYRGYVGLEYKATREDTFDWLPARRRARASEHIHHFDGIEETREHYRIHRTRNHGQPHGGSSRQGRPPGRRL